MDLQLSIQSNVLYEFTTFHVKLCSNQNLFV